MQSVPSSLVFDHQPLDVTFHPTLPSPLLASAHINGEVRLSTQNPDWREKALVLSHQSSVRAVKFHPRGDWLAAGTKNSSVCVIDVETQKTVSRRSGGSKAEGKETSFEMSCEKGDGVNALNISQDGIIVTGDDSGCVRLWDVREKKAVMKWDDVHKEWISSIWVGPEHHSEIVVASGDGSVSRHKLRMNGGVEQVKSDSVDDEMLSMACIKNGKMLVCGTQTGVLQLFKWNYFGAPVEAFSGHPDSVDALVKLDEDTVITGSIDGLIRIVQIKPNAFLGVLGVHARDLPVERIAMSADRRFLASCSHDTIVKVWDTAFLLEEGDDDDEIWSGSEEDKGKAGKGSKAGQQAKSKRSKKAEKRKRKKAGDQAKKKKTKMSIDGEDSNEDQSASEDDNDDDDDDDEDEDEDEDEEEGDEEDEDDESSNVGEDLGSKRRSLLKKDKKKKDRVGNSIRHRKKAKGVKSETPQSSKITHIAPKKFFSGL